MSKPFHIIVADDDDDDQFIIKEAIKEFNNSQIRVTSVYDGSQLIDCLNRKGMFARENPGKTDLILLDINMPILNGLEALSKIKSDTEMKTIPVYMISTMRTIEKMDMCLSMGASNFYSKPNHISGYKTIIEEIFTNTLYSQQQF